MNSESGILSPWVRDGWRIDGAELDSDVSNLYGEGMVSGKCTVLYGESSPGFPRKCPTITV